MTPKLYIGIGKVLFIGPLDAIPPHSCMVPKFAAGLDRTFRILVEGEVQVTRSRYVAAGLVREMQAFGGRLAVLLIDPDLKVETCWDEAAVSSTCKNWPKRFTLKRGAAYPLDWGCRRRRSSNRASSPM